MEIENARAAWNRAVEWGQVERVDQALEGLAVFHHWRGRSHEGEAACRLAAEKLAATASGDGLRVLANSDRSKRATPCCTSRLASSVRPNTRLKKLRTDKTLANMTRKARRARSEKNLVLKNMMERVVYKQKPLNMHSIQIRLVEM